MKDIFKKLIQAKVEWQDAPNAMLQANFHNKLVMLRINDFPEEVLCTVLIDGEEQDFDDFPSNWTLPEHRVVAKGA